MRNTKKNRINSHLKFVSISTLTFAFFGVILVALGLFLNILLIRSIDFGTSNFFGTFMGMAFITWLAILIPNTLIWVIGNMNIKRRKSLKVFSTEVYKRISSIIGRVLLLAVFIWMLLWAYLITHTAYQGGDTLDIWLIALVPIGITVFLLVQKELLKESVATDPKQFLGGFALASFVSLLVGVVSGYMFFMLGFVLSLNGG